MSQAVQADVGLTGMATMGRNLARNIASHGFTVAVHNRTQAKTDTLVRDHGDEGDFVATSSLDELVRSLERPRRVLVMVAAGSATDAVIDELVPLLDPGDVIADCGNANLHDTLRRQAALQENGIQLLGVGVSGGEEGALRGPSIMPGGDLEAYRLCAEIFENAAAVARGEPCCRYLGPAGAGSLVKMIHNGIEYAIMQLIGEVYDALRQAGRTPADIAGIFQDWNQGPLSSYLLEIAAIVLTRQDPATNSPFVDVVSDRAEQKGTGRWTVQSGLDLGAVVSTIAEAVSARTLSGLTEQRPLPEDRFFESDRPDLAGSVNAEDLRDALLAGSIVAYTQGFDVLRAANQEWGWDVSPADVATVWRGGCIIRSELLEPIRTAYTTEPDLPNLLSNPAIAALVADAAPGWRRTVAAAALAGLPTPVASSSLHYYDALHAKRLPTALIQGMRDLFGHHGFERTDLAGQRHVDWSGDGAEEQAG